MNSEFEVHILNEGGIEKARTIADIFDRALNELTPLMGPGRYNALVRTKLEEGSFFAKKAMAINVENQKA
jgi:hypothetical protein